MLKYRADIDGLRALAVSAVVAFHAGLPGVNGGFAGVDVFFVISGFLITGLLVSERATSSRIDLLGFWVRRARRLAPALLIVVIVVLLAAPFVLQRISGETGALAKAAIASVMISSNHFFLASSGEYFGAAAETNPLLHMWSLSVEEQFYLVWPLVLALLWKPSFPRRKQTKLLMGCIVLASFAGACFWTVEDSPKAFYLMPLRAWELIAGAMLAFQLHDRSASTDSALGCYLSPAALLILLGSFVFLDGQTGFPGPFAAITVLGTVLLILGGHLSPNSLVSRYLGARWIAYLGKISYPLYLWHWPILVMSRSNRLYEPSMPKDLLAVAVSIFLAVLTYEFVEKGAWKYFAIKPRILTAKSPVVFALSGAVVVIAIALTLGMWARFGWNYSAEERTLDAARKDMPRLDCMFQSVPSDNSMEACLGDTSKTTILLWGDSHANHWRPAITSAADSQGINLATLTMNACKPLRGPVGTPECIVFNAKVLSYIEHWNKRGSLLGIIISARWPEGAGVPAPSIADAGTWGSDQYFDARAHSAREALQYLEGGMNEFASELARQNKRLLVIEPSPVQRFAAVHCLALRSAKTCGVSMQELIPYIGPPDRVIHEVAQRNRNVRAINPLEFMCNPDRCPVVDGKTIIYSDDDHVTRSYSEMQAPNFIDATGWLVFRDNGGASLRKNDVVGSVQ